MPYELQKKGGAAPFFIYSKHTLPRPQTTAVKTHIPRWLIHRAELNLSRGLPTPGVFNNEHGILNYEVKQVLFRPKRWEIFTFGVLSTVAF